MFMCMCVSVYPPSSSKYLPFILSSFTGILPPNPLRISYELLCPQQSPKLLVDSGMQPLISWKSLCFIFLKMHFQTCPVTKRLLWLPLGQKEASGFCAAVCDSLLLSSCHHNCFQTCRKAQTSAGDRNLKPLMTGIPTNYHH